MVRLVPAWLGKASPGMARNKVRHGEVGRGKDWRGRARLGTGYGEVRCGAVGLG